MSASAIRFSSNGKIAVAISGEILTVDFSAGPSPLGVAHNFRSGVIGYSDFSLSPLTIQYSYSGSSAPRYYALNETPMNDGGYWGSCELDIHLSLLQGNVRWDGTFGVFSTYGQPQGIFSAWSIVTVSFNCPAGTVNPRGTYTITGVVSEKLNGDVPNTSWVTRGSSVVVT